jgi:phosphoserine phosphatase
MKNSQLEVVSFDLDGTILRGHILAHTRIPETLHKKIVEHDALFFNGKLGYEETLAAQFGLFAGMRIEEIAPDPDKLPLIGGLHETLGALKCAGVACLVLTDNPSFAADPLGKFGFQGIIGSEVEAPNGVLTGRIKLLTNKLEGLQNYCGRHGIGLESCAHVGDWVNDIVVFKAVGRSVAFNASEESVSRAATYTVNSDSLLDVYRVLEPDLPRR